MLKDFQSDAPDKKKDVDKDLEEEVYLDPK